MGKRFFGFTSILDKYQFSKYQYFALALVLLLGAAIRFYNLGEWSFWYDEIFTLRDIEGLKPPALLLERPSLLLSAISVSLFGVSEWSARFVPALIGVLSIPTLYFLVRTLFNPTIAILSVLLLAVSPWHLYWSQNARFYTALLLFYTLALFAFYWGIEKDRPWYLVLFMVLFGLAVRERLFALFILPVVAGYLILVKILPFPKPPGLRMRNLMIIFIPGMIMVMILGGNYVLDPSRLQLKLETVNNSPFWIVSGVVYYLGLPLICLGAAGGLILLYKKERSSLLLLLAALVPLAALIVLSLIQYSANRYAFVTLPAWIILASVAVHEVFTDTKISTRVIAAGVLLLVVFEPLSEDVLYFKYQNGNRDDWKAAFNFIKRNKEPGDIIALSNYLLGNYYMGEETININRLNLDVLDPGTRIWFVEDMTVQSKNPSALRWIQENGRAVANYDVPVRARNFKMRVYLYDSTLREAVKP